MHKQKEEGERKKTHRWRWKRLFALFFALID
jgi:hypothetical protein